MIHVNCEEHAKNAMEDISEGSDLTQDLDSCSEGRVPGLQKPKRREDRQCDAYNL